MKVFAFFIFIFCSALVLIEADEPLDNYESIVEALVDGYPMTFVVDTSLCETENGTERETDLGTVSLEITNYEYFYGDRFGDLHYVGTADQDIVLTEDGHRLRLLQARAYEDERARLRIIYARLNDSVTEQIDILWCPINKAGSPGAKFIPTPGIEPEHLTTYAKLVTALEAGEKVRFSSHYYSCGPSPQETIGGGIIMSYDVDETTNTLSYHVGSMIVNYFEEDEGFLFNGASGQAFGNTERVEFKPWALTFGDWEEQYVSFYDCPINDGTFDGGLYYYKVDTPSENSASQSFNIYLQYSLLVALTSVFLSRF